MFSSINVYATFYNKLLLERKNSKKRTKINLKIKIVYFPQFFSALQSLYVGCSCMSQINTSRMVLISIASHIRRRRKKSY